MKKTSVAMCVLFSSLLTGCATTGTDGVVEIGPNMYMIGGLGGFTDFSSSGVKGRLYQQAASYCTAKNKVMLPMNSSGKDSGVGTYSSAEIQFQCVSPSDSRVAN